MSIWNFLLSWVEHKKSFITLEPDISKMATITVNLKFCKHLPNHMSDLTETLLEALVQHWDSESVPTSVNVAMLVILKFFKQHLPNNMSDWTKTWLEAMVQHGDSESNIQVGPYCSHLKILQTESTLELSVCVWVIKATWQFRTGKIVLFPYIQNDNPQVACDLNLNPALQRRKGLHIDINS